MKTLEILCISLAAIGLILLYLQYKNHKTMEMMHGTMLAIQQPVHPIPGDLVNQHILLHETQQLKSHIDAKTLDVHDHLNMVLQSIDRAYGEKKDENTVQKRSYTEMLDNEDDISGIDVVETNDLNEPLQLNSSIPSQENYQSQSQSRSRSRSRSRSMTKSKSISLNSHKSAKSTEFKKSLEEYDMNDIINTEDTVKHTIPLTTTNVSISNDSTTVKYPHLPELRLLCKSRNLSMVGNKKVLINRLIENGYEF
jgi:hypothetical protein